MTGQSVTVELPTLETKGTDPNDLESLPDNVTTETLPPDDQGGKKTRDYKAERLRRKNAAGAPGTARRGRPPKVKPADQVIGTGKPPAEGTDAETMGDTEKRAFADALTMAFQLSFQLVATRRGPHWQLSKVEGENLGATWAVALEPFAGNLGKWLPLAMASVLLVGTVGNRIVEDAARAERADAEEKRRTNPGAQVVT